MLREIAIFSASNKEGLGSLARALESQGMEIVATGKTRSVLEAEGLKVADISDLTQEPERFGGRLKTLHHKVLGGILLRPGQDEAEWPYDFRVAAVVCNFYPFEEKAAGCKTNQELIEWIDIGGPTMVRAAAKNFEHVWVFTRPQQYARFIGSPFGELDPGAKMRLRQRLSLEAFEMVRQLDEAIVAELQNRYVNIQSELRYGENPQQKASFLANLKIQPKIYGEMSFNNIRDAEAALRFCTPFRGPAVSVVKHQTLCGAAVGLEGAKADEVFNLAWEGDTVSRFGGVLGMNFIPTPAMTEVFEKKFIEVLVLPRSEESERWSEQIRQKKEKLRIMLVAPNLFGKAPAHREVFQGVLGRLIQDADSISAEGTEKDPAQLLHIFGQWAGACSKSNAIVLAGYEERFKSVYLAGAGQGQPNRIDSLRLLAVPRAKDFAQRMEVDFSKLICFSDAFIPFSDTLQVLKEVGVSRFVQPGGSKQDEENKKVAQELGIQMSMTGVRHFWH